MKVMPLFSDSLGVRSMATYIETKDCNILLDPSAALGPKRYGLLPTQIELQTLQHAKKIIAQKAAASDILTISHYHYDHYDPTEKIYKNKIVYAKNAHEHINKSQQQRGTEFQKLVDQSCTLIHCDNGNYIHGETHIDFSPPFYHGPDKTRLGYIIMTAIQDQDTRLLYASDVQGPITTPGTEYIIKQHPDVLILDGPPTYLLGWKFSQNNLDAAKANLLKILDTLDCEILLDHHLLRDLQYKKHFVEIYTTYADRVKTFAEYLGKENNTLEANRKELWKKEV